uniref:Uncharacterized protein n=1 Tax=Zea mays TaxID=4577 RepID=B8A1U9_MAIZE|nr:unknown [Zea mays]
MMKINLNQFKRYKHALWNLCTNLLIQWCNRGHHLSLAKTRIKINFIVPVFQRLSLHRRTPFLAFPSFILLPLLPLSSSLQVLFLVKFPPRSVVDADWISRHLPHSSAQRKPPPGGHLSPLKGRPAKGRRGERLHKHVLAFGPSRRSR